VLIAGAATLSLGWALLARNLSLSYEAYNPASRDGAALIRGADPDRQLATIVADPTEFLAMAAGSVRRAASFIAYSFIGQLGWDVFLPPTHAYLHGLMLVVLALAGAGGGSGGGATVGWPIRLLLGGVAVAGLSTVALLCYLVWTPVGAPFVNGIHGRYLIAVAAPAFLAVTPLRREGAAVFRWAVPLLAALSLAFSSFALAERYYG
jgi:hypothetical protein